ncbi:MAG: phage portal protein [Actinobacteria bacterium]|nr:phage portal protein [Actinomycetota bacterium]
MIDDPTAYITEGYSGNSDVFSIINRIIRMQEQASLVLYTMKDGKRVEVTDHELSKFTRTANGTMKMRDFREGHFIYKLSIGNSYWYKPIIENGLNKGKTQEIWLMPSNNVEIIGSGNWMNPVGGYVLETNTTVEFNPDEVLHSKFFNPLFGQNSTLYGQSPLKAAAKTVSKQNEAELTELKQFENQSPPYILYRDIQDQMGGLSLDQKDEIEEIFKDYAKKYKKGHPVVLPDKFGMLKLGISPADLNIIKSSQEGRRVLCNIFGLPSELLNDKASSTYNNVIEVKKDAWSNCIIPNLEDFASDLTAFLINPVPEYVAAGLFYGFDYSNVQELQTDIGKKVTWMRQAYWTPNQILEATGKPPVKNPLMDEPLIGMGESFLSDYSVSLDSGAKDFSDYLRTKTTE